MGVACCGEGATFEGLSADYKRRLWIVIAINAAMFLVEIGAGALAGSQALQADALDFLGDAATYGISLAVIGASVRVRARAAFVKGVSLTLVGLWVFGATAYHVLVLGVPRAEIMGAIGFLALAANVASVVILVRYKDGDANVRSVWLCSRNDAIGNVAVMLAALGVWATATKWPDLIVAAIMAGLFLWSSAQILRQAVRELRTGEISLHTHVPHTHAPPEWVRLRDRFAAATRVFVTDTRVKIAALASLVLLWLASGFFTIQSGEIGLRLRFARIIAADLGPGLHYRLPWPIETHRLVETERTRSAELGFRSQADESLTARSLARERLTVGGPSNPVPEAIKAKGPWFQREVLEGESFLLTGDANLIDLRSTVQYRVKDPVAYVTNLAEPEALVRSVARAALRSAIATQRIDALLTKARAEVEARLHEFVQARLDGLNAGIALVSVRLVYVHSPQEAHDAERDVASAQEDKLRTINRAKGFAAEEVNEAKGEAAATVEGALAVQEEHVRRARGEALAFSLQVEAFRQAPELAAFRLQMETIEDVLPKVHKLVRPKASAIKDFDLWLLEPPISAGGNR
ncbi:HflK protein [Bradyrhizobium sp. AZCC 1578]